MKIKMLAFVLVFFILYAFPVRTCNAQLADWPMNEGSGNKINDATGNSYTGTILGATWKSGINGSALNFDGVNDYVQIPSSLKTPNAITVEAWIKADDLNKGGPSGHHGFVNKHKCWNFDKNWTLRDTDWDRQKVSILAFVHDPGAGGKGSYPFLLR